MAKRADPRIAAIAALAAIAARPEALPLHGSAKQPAVFSSSSKAAREAAEICLGEGWLEPTGESIGRGAKAKPLYRLSAAGRRAVLEESEPIVALRGMWQAVESRLGALAALQTQFEAFAHEMQHATSNVRQAVEAEVALLQNIESQWLSQAGGPVDAAPAAVPADLPEDARPSGNTTGRDKSVFPSLFSPGPSSEPDAARAATGRRNGFAAAFEHAFHRLDATARGTNQVKLLDLRAALMEFSRAEFDSGLRALRRAGQFALESADGTHFPLTAAEREAGIVEAGSLLVYAAQRR